MKDNAGNFKDTSKDRDALDVLDYWMEVKSKRIKTALVRNTRGSAVNSA